MQIIHKQLKTSPDFFSFILFVLFPLHIEET